MVIDWGTRNKQLRVAFPPSSVDTAGLQVNDNVRFFLGIRGKGLWARGVHKAQLAGDGVRVE